MSTKVQNGSEWNIWDLHVHSPESFGGEDYDTFITNLSKSEALVIGVNDYCSLGGYKKIIAKGGVSNKILFPVIEFRMHNIVANRKSATDGGTKINFHLIFDNSEHLFSKIETWFNSLHCINGSGNKAHLGTISTTELLKVTVDFADVLQSLNEIKLKEHCLVWLPYDEYGGIDDIDSEDNFFKLHLIKQADIMGSSREKQIQYFKWKDPKFTEEQYKQYFDAPKPCIKGSDSHQIDYPFGRLKNDKSEPIEKFCWIKSNPTFNGLKQIVYEPNRVFIGREPDLLVRIKSFPHKFLKSVFVGKEIASKSAEVWFEDVLIFLNPSLIAIIGKKGNGKSAIADILGLCGNAKNNKDDLSFLHKDKFKNSKANKSKDFKAKITWYDGTDSGDINLNSEINALSEERIKYIPQNYLEKLCVNEEQKEFEEELKKIIFAHIPSTERLGQSSLDDLINSKQKSVEEGIANLKLEISRINKTISRLEVKTKPSYNRSVSQQIAEKDSELQHHANNKPQEKIKPDEDEAQKAINGAIIQDLELKQASLKLIEAQKTTLELEIGSNNISLSELSGVKVETEQLNKTLQKFISEKKPLLAKYEIDVEEVVKYTIKLNSITDKILTLTERNAQISIALNGNDEVVGLIQQIATTKSEIATLQGQLAQTQKEYHEYLQNLENWEKRKKEIIGSGTVPGTLEFLKIELNYISTTIEKELEELYGLRNSIAIEIYSLKQELLDIYTSLYRPVTQVLESESSFVEDYQIKVNASLTIKAFIDRFLNFINQKSKGTYSGSNEGREMIDHLLSLHSVTSEEELLEFLNEVVGSLKMDSRQGYKGEERYVDEQLKKDIKLEDLYDFIFSLNYVEPQFKLQLGNKDLKTLSPGERGAILLIFYLFLDLDNKPLIIDQPEENLDNESIYHYLVHFIKKAKEKRQIIIITHNPNLAVVCDAEQIIHMAIDKQNLNKVSFETGAIEDISIAKKVINILEGTKPAFDNRRLKYLSVITN